eukprot:1189943-Prorocentrum_minimum.AAC.1
MCATCVNQRWPIRWEIRQMRCTYGEHTLKIRTDLDINPLKPGGGGPGGVAVRVRVPDYCGLGRRRRPGPGDERRLRPPHRVPERGHQQAAQARPRAAHLQRRPRAARALARQTRRCAPLPSHPSTVTHLYRHTPL